MSTLDNMIIAGRCRMAKAKENFKEFWTAEKGVSNVVATIIILLIVVLVIGLFWDRLSVWLSNMMNDIFDPNQVPGKSDLNVNEVQTR